MNALPDHEQCLERVREQLKVAEAAYAKSLAAAARAIHDGGPIEFDGAKLREAIVDLRELELGLLREELVAACSWYAMVSGGSVGSEGNRIGAQSRRDRAVDAAEKAGINVAKMFLAGGPC